MPVDLGMKPVAARPHQPPLPPQASPTPSSLACPHGEEGSALVLSFALRLWQSAWSFPSLSFIDVYGLPSLWIDRQLSFLVLLFYSQHHAHLTPHDLALTTCH
jgi:hypothetical protein